MLFKHFDVDDSNYLTKENIKEAIDRLHLNITDEEMDIAFKQHDVKGSG